ncbi:hypothetical protein QVG61_08275 [Thiohalobacter sp. IOR34]|uniref:hypothetical protein n=1 Tax=Thiohalobacter sp. IOR34 TaxID=3057176 RepID=UPI0025B14279|nr:hypothetical protein [Thiohalobacter sp. IOR34]WJW74508.1 hypothetical protein QVG61_08275 [Thiohalobacter sp. IOR34]
MEQRTHLLEIYEPYEFDGNNPLHITGGGVLRGANGAFYYLVTASQGLSVDGQAVEQLLLLPRYNEDPIKAVQESTCTVNIERVLPGVRLEPNHTFSYNDIEHWGVGKISPNGRDRGL